MEQEPCTPATADAAAIASRFEAGLASGPYFVAVGASGAAGLEDLKALLAALPASLPAVVIVVLHRPCDRLSHLREILSRASNMPVSIGRTDEAFRVGHCYVGEPDFHLALAEAGRMRLVEGAGHKHRNRTVDLLFESVATHARSRGVGVVLSGRLDDGSRGLAAIAHAGGATMVLGCRGVAQAGMPQSAASYEGSVDVTGSAEEIAFEIAARVRA
jgi:chemotaxis response regulator CheB